MLLSTSTHSSSSTRNVPNENLILQLVINVLLVQYLRYVPYCRLLHVDLHVCMYIHTYAKKKYDLF